MCITCEDKGYIKYTVSCGEEDTEQCECVDCLAFEQENEHGA